MTGAGGFIGRNLLKRLGGKYEILAPAREELNLLDGKVVEDYLKRYRFDVVIHSANTNNFSYRMDDYDILDRNLRMFYHLEKNNGLYGKMLYFGSGAQYSSQHYIPHMREEYFGTFLPTDPYGFAKYTMSRIVDSSRNIYDLRLFGVYGPYEQWQRRFISNALCRVIKGMPITISQNVYFDYLHVYDLCRIVEWFIENDPKHHAYNVCCGDSVDLRSIADKIMDLAGSDVEIIVAREGYKPEYSGSNDRLLEELGEFAFTPLEKGIKELYEFYLENKEEINPEQLI